MCVLMKSICSDTGGPQTTGPNTTVYAYYSQIPGAVDITNDGKAWNVPCSTVMPDLTMRFAEQGGVELIIPGASFLQANNGDGSKLFVPLPFSFLSLPCSRLPFSISRRVSLMAGELIWI